MENKKFLDLGGLEHYNDKVQAKLDAKVDSSSMSDYYTKSQTDANIATEADARQNADAGLQTQINSLASGSPLVASSIAGMTDTSRVYVNTTDGKWYYWNGSAWTAGGTYQSTGIASNSVYAGALTDDVRKTIYRRSSDISKLGKLNSSAYTNTSGYSATTPILILAGTTLTFSNDFISNYHWCIRRITNGKVDSVVKAESTDQSYTPTQDIYGVICWRPIDNNWGTEDYTVDRKHYLDNNDLSMVYYYNVTNNLEGIPNGDLPDFSFMLRGYEAGSLRIFNYTRYGNTIPIQSSSKTKIILSDNNYQMAIVRVEVASDGDGFTTISDTGWIDDKEYTVEANTKYIINVRRTDNASMDNAVDYYNLRKAISITAYPTFTYVDSVYNQIPEIIPDYDKYIKGVNHRGYSTTAPENTIPAYVLSAKNGFKYVECDVQFTSDGVPVLLHDNTIDRTSNGTGNISDLTWAEVRQYDFGSWKSSAYAGTKIPSLYEFLKCCKDLGLSPYIEIKWSNVTFTQAQVQQIVDIVKLYGMEKETTYISQNYTYLAYVRDYDSKARLGLIASLSSDNRTLAAACKTTDNEVFLDCTYNSDTITTDNINLIRNAGIGLEVWTVDSEDTIMALNSYITGVTSNNKIAGKVLFDAALDS